MKVLLCAFLCAIVSVNARASFYDQYKQRWVNYKKEFQKKYETEEEDTRRFRIFVENLLFIDEHNERYKKGEVFYTTGINQFTDMLTEEVSKKMNGFKPRPNQQRTTSKSKLNKTTEVPDSIDWVEKGAVTPVKNQLTCGSCWAFSATGALEGRNFIKNGNLVSLSEQNLIDCSAEEGNQGCDGGYIESAFDYVIKNDGLDTEASYPYEAKDDKCRFNASSIGVTETSYVGVTPEDEDELKLALIEGPVSAAIDGTLKTFQQYRGGIFEDPNCSQNNLSHGVLIVGYGYDKKEEKPYWLIKNSWGTTWGEKGYIRILRNEQNICGVTSNVTYPVI